MFLESCRSLSLFMGRSTRLLLSLKKGLICYYFNLSLRQHICGTYVEPFFVPTIKELQQSNGNESSSPAVERHL